MATTFNAVNEELQAQTSVEPKGPTLAASILNDLSNAEAGLLHSQSAFTSDAKVVDGRATLNSPRDAWAIQTNQQVALGNLPKVSLV